MKWPLAVLVAALLAAGCRTPAPTFDPFAGRTTVPPPGTGNLTPPSVSVPYYQGAPPPGAAPTTTYPDTVPPGGYGYPQGSHSAGSAEGFAQAPAEIHIPEETTRPLVPAEQPQSRLAAEPTQRQHVAAEPSVRVPDDSEAARFQLPEIAAVSPAEVNTAPRAMPSQPAARLVPYQPRVVSQPPVQAIAPQQTITPQVVTPQPMVTQVSAPQPIARPMVAQPGIVSYDAAASLVDPCACEPQPFVVAPGAVEITQLPSSRARASAQPTVASAGATVSTSAARFAVQQASHAAPIKAEFQQPTYRYGYESDDYRWLRGKLEYLHSTQQWKLRYIPIDGETDEYGGSVLIDNPDALADLEPGDFVTLHGKITHEPDDASSFAPLYLVERATPLK